MTFGILNGSIMLMMVTHEVRAVTSASMTVPKLMTGVRLDVVNVTIMICIHVLRIYTCTQL